MSHTSSLVEASYLQQCKTGKLQWMLGFQLQLPHVNNFTATQTTLKVLLSTDITCMSVLIPRPCPGNEDSEFVVPIEAFVSGTKMELSDQCRADQWIR